MASTITTNRPYSLVNPRTVLRNKLANERNARLSTGRKNPLVPSMSKEAMEAMVMTRQDSKENLKSPTRKNILPPMALKTMSISENDNNNNSSVDSSPKRTNLNLAKSKTLDKPHRKIPPIGSNSTTARSRSTLSRTIPSTSTSDRITNKATAGDDSCAMTNDLYAEDEDDINSNFKQGADKMKRRSDAEVSLGSHGEDDEESMAKDEEDDGDEDNEQNPKSFVLALDRALESKCISRLRGDITDTKGISEPGKVRALDGGRLANAQEVVVNVCFDDDKELVFHDDDHESLDTARAISDIRVNLWLEYNKNFQHDNSTDDFDIEHDHQTTTDKSKLQVPQTPRNRDSRHNLPPTGARQNTSLAVRSFSRGKSAVARRDGNNNTTTTASNKVSASNSNVGSAKSKSGASGSCLDTSSTRIGSALSTDSRRSVSSAPKKESFLRRKAPQV